MKDKKMPEPSTSLRHVKAVDLDAVSDLLPTYESSWAVIVGINSYQNVGFNRLENALKDALGIAEVLITRLDFPRENVFFALDPKPDPSELSFALPSNVKSASKAGIEDLLLNVLPEKVRENDRVLVFYAGHGDQRPVPGEKDGSRAFLIPADAQPSKWNTYVEWEAVRRAGNEFCKAKHIFYILDACYSGIVNTRDASEPPREVRDALSNCARQVLAAGTSRQVVADAGREGHSPFTWHLIQGLRGDAVNPQRSTEGSVISAHDLIGYVRRRVAEENSTEQTPSGGSIGGHRGGDFIFTSPLIGFSSQEHLRLGVGLMDLGLRSGERVCFESAVRNLQDACRLKRLAGEDAGEAEEWLGRALFHTDSDEALQVLDVATAQGRTTALLYLGIAHAKRRNVNAACQSLELFAEHLPTHADAAWAAAFARQLHETEGKRNHALLVGINKYLTPGADLTGCTNDVLLVKSLLEEVFGFDPAGIKTLTDEQATKSNIIAGLEDLAAMARQQDTVVFFFSGHGSNMPALGRRVPKDRRWYILCPHDLDWKAPLAEPQLHTLLTQIPARNKLFIADAPHVCPDSDTSAVGGGYCFFGACQRTQTVSDTQVDGTTYGAFTHSLCRIVRESAAKGNLWNAGRIVNEVKRTLKEESNLQTPVYFGSATMDWVSGMDLASKSDFLAFHDFGDRCDYKAIDVSDLEFVQTRLEALGDVPHPRAWLSCARAWQNYKQSKRATACVMKALAQPGVDELEARLLLCEIQLHDRTIEAAIQNSNVIAGYLPSPEVNTLIDKMVQLASPHRHALIVAIEQYPKHVGIKPRGPCADADALKAALVDRCGFAVDDIDSLINEKATRRAILSKVKELAQHATTEPALFYFAGLGTETGSGPALVVADASRTREISMISLADLSHSMHVQPTNLVTIIDAGWTIFSNPTPQKMATMRVIIPEDQKHTYYQIDEQTVYRDPSRIPSIGMATIYANSITKIYEHVPKTLQTVRESKRERRFMNSSTRGSLTMALVDALNHPDVLTMTYSEWVSTAASAKPHIFLQRGDACLFENAVLLERTLWLASQLRDRNLHETEELLNRLAELRKGRDPNSYLDLTVARLMRNRYEAARDAVEMCLAHRRQDVMVTHADLVTLGDVFWPEAHYLRGRVLFTLRHYSAAESALGIALQQIRDNPSPQNVHEKVARDAQLARAHYWHARAVQELIGQNLMTAAETDFRKYLRFGAPFGDAERATAFLAERTKSIETQKSKGRRKTKTAKRTRV